MEANEKPRRWWFAACGLDCSTCSIHLRTKEELDYWRSQNVDPEKIRCNGCRSDRNGHHWSPECKILECCVDKRGLEFCAQCSDFPCEIIAEWERMCPPHEKAVQEIHRMKKTGIEKWLKDR